MAVRVNLNAMSAPVDKADPCEKVVGKLHLNEVNSNVE